MVYAKQVVDGELSAILTYDYMPVFGDDSNTFIITEEEYNALMEEIKAKVPEQDPDIISAAEALEIITGGEV